MLTPQDILARKKSGKKVSMITAYDFAFARMAEEAGVDQILVGDSLANTMLGYKSTREIGMTEMLIFAAAVCRGAPNTHVIGDMPYMSDKDPSRLADSLPLMDGNSWGRPSIGRNVIVSCWAHQAAGVPLSST